MIRSIPLLIVLAVFGAAACGSASSPRERYISALNYRLEGNSEAYYNALITLANDAPDSRAGRRARSMLQASDVTTAVAIVGVLSAIAIPNFLKFQNQARQAEAKSTLKSMFASQKAYEVEHGTFCKSFEECAYSPPPGSRYLYFMSPQEIEGGDSASDTSSLRMQANILLNELNVEPEVKKNRFLLVAVGDLDSDQDLDVWMIDEANNLVNLVNDLE